MHVDNFAIFLLAQLRQIVPIVYKSKETLDLNIIVKINFK
jgi:hypothetical protein